MLDYVNYLREMKFFEVKISMIEGPSHINPCHSCHFMWIFNLAVGSNSKVINNLIDIMINVSC